MCCVFFLSGFCGGAIYVEVVLNEDINEIGDVASSAEDTIETIGSLVRAHVSPVTTDVMFSTGQRLQSYWGDSRIR